MTAATVAGSGFGFSLRPYPGKQTLHRPRSSSPTRAAVLRRRRLVAASVFVVLVLGAVLAGAAALRALGGGPLTASEGHPAAVVTLEAAPVSARTYVVHDGDTLWSIARRVQPDGDIRPLVDEMQTARHGRPLVAGEVIALPALTNGGR